MTRFTVLIIVCFLALTSFSQDNAKTRKKIKAEKEAKRIEHVDSILAAKNFLFVPTYALPMGGSSIYLNSSYDLKIKGDSAISYLPFFGVAYYAEYGGSNGGIEFSEPYGDYTIKPVKSGKEIRFNVKTAKDTYRFLLTTSNIGYATLHVDCINRQPIQFNGMIEEVKAGQK
jgi:hypothetical protein